MLYKVLNDDGSAFHGGTGKWNLPHGARPGKWMLAISDPIPCERGYHLCRREDLINWLGPAIYEAEGRGEMVEAPDKVVYGQARLLRRLDTWTERTARLFACDCAERVVHLCGDDLRPREAIQVARLFADGKATIGELSAARSAARDTAKSAAWDAAKSATMDAAWAAAKSATKAWQTDRLFEYLEGGAS